METKKTFGSNVRFYRNAMNLSQESLAELMEVSKNTIHDIETGKKFVRIQNLVQLANVFNIEPFELIASRNAKKVNRAGAFIHFANEVKEKVESIRDDYIKGKNT